MSGIFITNFSYNLLMFCVVLENGYVQINLIMYLPLSVSEEFIPIPWILSMVLMSLKVDINVVTAGL